MTAPKPIRFVPHPAAIPALGMTPEIAAMLKAQADASAEESKDLARTEAYDTGDYMNGIEPVVGVEDGRMIARVNGKDFKSHWIEFGVLGRLGKHILARGAEALGLRIEVGGGGKGLSRPARQTPATAR